jgi:hypothetical protein
MSEGDKMKAREWTLEFDSNFDDHPPIVRDGPAISGYEAEVKVIEHSAYDKAVNALRVIGTRNFINDLDEADGPEEYALTVLKELGESV